MNKGLNLTPMPQLQKFLLIISKTSTWDMKIQVFSLTTLIRSLQTAVTTLFCMQLSRKKKLKRLFSPSATIKLLVQMASQWLSTKKKWHLLKNDIPFARREFHPKAIINKNINTFITLIAKKTCCNRPIDYRPISLTTSLQKIIAKTMVERLKCTLPDTISESQLAFVKDRKITNAILVTNEMVDY